MYVFIFSVYGLCDKYMNTATYVYYFVAYIFMFVSTICQLCAYIHTHATAYVIRRLFVVCRPFVSGSRHLAA